MSNNDLLTCLFKYVTALE